MPEFSRLTRQTVGLLALASPRFGHWVSCSIPLVATRHPYDIESPTDTLFVLLPGIQDQHLDFEERGFVAAVKKQEIRADIIAVDAHIGYYVRETILERLRNDIIRPARDVGYKRIWLVGTSLGGLGSALYAGRHEHDIDGLLLLAPFLGERSLIRQINAAGSPKSWTPQKEVPEFQVELWKWLNSYFDAPERKPSLFLGFGNKDRFAYAHSFLGEILPENQVLVRPGGHDWKTWQALWIDFLERYKVPT